MSGHHTFSELTKHFTPEARKIIEAKKAEMRAAMQTEEPRKAAETTEKTPVQTSHVTAANTNG